jgi:hypothetical protein
MSTGKTYSTKYLLDSNNNRGSEGQILSTTSTGIDWVDANSVPGTGLWVTSGNNIYNSNSGNVGIGTTSPTEKLHVEGNIEFINGGWIGSLDGSYWQRIRFEDATPATTNAFNFETRNGSGAFVNHMTILNNGNVGIGTSSPNQKLQVGGNLHVYDEEGDTDAAIFISTGTSNTTTVTVRSNGNSYFNGGNVGIGTTSPGVKLEVVGNTTITGAAGTTLKIEAKNDTAFNDPRIEFVTWNVASGASSGRIQLTNGTFNSNDMAFFTETGNSVTEKMRITSAGNVGINCTPSYKLQWSDGTRTGLLDTNIGAVVIGSVSNDALALYTNLTEKMRILANGNVGIGTTSPSQKLEVAGSVAVTGTNVTVANASNPYIYINDTNAGAGIFQQEGNTTRIGSDSNTQVVLVQNNATAVTIDTSKNVGIGTTSPGYRLEVDGGIGDGVKIKAGNAASKDSLLVSTNNNVSKFLVQGDGKVIINSSAGISGRNENFQVFGEQIITNTGTDGPVLYLGYNSSGSNTIQLGRGRTADGLSYMDFNGEVMSAGQFGFRIIRYSGQNASTELKQVGTGAFKVTCSNSANIILNPNSGSVGISQTNPSYKLDVTGNGRFTSTVTATNFILSSDERLKENVEKVCDNKVEADWKTFELKTEKGQKRYGVIAQELEKTNPEFVREDSQGFKSVAYIDLLIAKIAELEARLEKLEK